MWFLGCAALTEDWRFQTDDDFADRPGLSPVLAALASAGVFPKRARILDVGCGTGIDAVGLAVALPHARVTGVDQRAQALAIARERALAAEVEGRVEFRRASALKLPFAPRSFDAAVDTLLGNNLRTLAPYAAQLARVLRPDGLLVAAHKVEPGTDALPEFTSHGPFAKAFEVGPQVATQLPLRTWARRRGFVDVVVLVARRR